MCGRRDVRDSPHVWAKGCKGLPLCKSLFRSLVDPSPLRMLVFLVLRIKIPRKVRFFTRQVLHS